jgi:hypothetical protein
MEMKTMKFFTGAKKGMLFTLLTLVLVTLMLAIVMTYLLLNINYSDQASEAYGILGSDNFASLIQSAMPSALAASLQNARNAYLSANVVGWWPLTSNANDYSSNGNNGAPTNVVYAAANGIQAASFDGASSYISVPAQQVFAGPGTNQYTISFWSYRTDTSGWRAVMGQNNFPRVQFNGDELAIDAFTPDVSTIASCASSTNTWEFWVVEITGTGVTFYKNGAFCNSFDGTIYFAAGNITIGIPTSGANYYQGSLADLQIYDAALSAGQVSSLYGEGIGGAPITPPMRSAITFPINNSAANTLSSIVLGIPSLPGSTLSSYASALQRQSLARNVHLTITNQSATVFQTSPLWLNLTYSALEVVNSTFGTVAYPLHSNVALPTAMAYSNITLSQTEGATFDGSDSYINVGNVPGISPSSTAWTLSFWMNSNSVTDYKNALDANFNPSPNNAGPRFEQSSPSDFGLVIGTGQTYFNGYLYSDAFTSNTWYYVVAERSGDDVVGYLNGVQVFNSPNTLWPSGFANLTIGRGWADSSDRWFSGSIANIQVYNASLSANQVASTYSEGVDAVPLQNGLVGWWPLDGNSKDYSGNGNNGAAYGVEYSSSNVPGQFQQMLTFNASQYSAYERADLGNIRFYQGNSELYSWCESGCTNASTTSVFWVKMPNGIPAFSDAVITMAFLSKYVDYDSGIGAHAGEAPQLSSTFGQYDNGANVFLQYSSSNSGYPAALYPPIPSVADIYVQYPNSESGLTYNQPGTISSSNMQVHASLRGSGQNIYFIYTFDGTNFVNGNFEPYTLIPGNYYLVTLTMASTSSYSMQVNYSPISAVSGTAETGGYYVVGGVAPYLRDRQYPPDGIMPAASFGGVVRLA